MVGRRFNRIINTRIRFHEIASLLRPHLQFLIEMNTCNVCGEDNNDKLVEIPLSKNLLSQSLTRYNQDGETHLICCNCLKARFPRKIISDSHRKFRLKGEGNVLS